jgi:choline kinase
MKVIILAAGEGSRLRPFTLDRPKCLVEVNGVSLLERQLEVLRTKGLTEIVLVGGYLAKKLRGTGLKVLLNERYAETNMVWTLFAAEPELDGEVIVAYGDIVYSPDILQSLMNAKADIAVTVDLDWESYWRARNEDPLADAESLKLDGDGRIMELGQKPKCIEEIQGQYMGLLKFSAVGLHALKQIFHGARASGSLRGKQPEKAYMTDALQAIIDSGFRVDAVPVRGPWVEVDTVSDLQSRVTHDRLSVITRLASEEARAERRLQF